VNRVVFFFWLFVFFLAGCASTPEQQPQSPVPEARPQPEAKRPSAEVPQPSAKGGYYKDDGPDEKPPANLASIPDAVPRTEPLHRYANRPYTVFGKAYSPVASRQPYKERGMASWYGKKFHGQKTSSGEAYDMYAMSAAHKTLPIPSYARVTNVKNGRSVVVRVNDRGPFHSDRIIDLSYAAAYKLGYIGAGSAMVEVESVEPGEAAAVKNTIEEKSTYIQVGAFSSRGNAEDFRERVARQLAWLTDGVQVLAIGNLWRLHVGPYATSDAARPIAERIEAELKLKPLLVTR
jgi:rare lipoprotein A